MAGAMGRDPRMTGTLWPPKGSPLVPGYELDRYQLLCPIADGGMASVWVARLVGKFGFEKIVAIKTMIPELAADPGFQRMFLDEARVAAAIQHTNVAQVLDLGEERGVFYLVMEWVDGDSLMRLHRAAARKGGAHPLGVLLRILTDACAGLHAAHELRSEDGEPLGVVHRDVSPENILVNAHGAAKLIDFGIAKAKNRLYTTSSKFGAVKGKVPYMAPEQATGGIVDRRADIWSMGATLYHLLCGKRAHEAPTMADSLERLAARQPPDPLPAHVHPAVRAIVEKAMDPSPAARFQTASELHDAFERAMVKAGARTTMGDVAAFAAQHLAERAEARRHALDVALKATAVRPSLHAMLTPTLCSSGPFVAAPPAHPSGAAMETPTRVERSSARDATVHDIPTLASRQSKPPPRNDSFRRAWIAVVLVMTAALGIAARSFLARRDAAPAPAPVITTSGAADR
jgi:serine/threonine-protein kinase